MLAKHNSPLVRRLGLLPYTRVFEDMRGFTHARFDPNRPDESASCDEIWLVQHPSVYTQGVRSSESPQSDGRNIPVVKSDRGGLMSYHGPGQIVFYPLLQLGRWSLNSKSLVNLLEQSVLDLLATYSITAQRKARAPGVYVDEKKIAALGLRIRHGHSYHGLSLNVNMDLRPFDDIDPCGFPGLEVTQLKDLGVDDAVDEVGEKLLLIFLQRLLAR